MLVQSHDETHPLACWSEGDAQASFHPGFGGSSVLVSEMRLGARADLRLLLWSSGPAEHPQPLPRGGCLHGAWILPGLHLFYFVEMPSGESGGIWEVHPFALRPLGVF